MEVEFAYGTGGLCLDLPEGRTTVVTPRPLAAAPDPRAELLAALRRPVSGPPLRQRVRRGQSVAIAVCDGTRPQPRASVLEALLAELEGIARLDDIVVLVATGTHRANNHSELLEMLGPDVLSSVAVLNHDARDAATLAQAGHLEDGTPVWLNARWLEADVRITTGLVEPHFFAGFSGGPKLVAPGLAGLATTLRLHDAARIGHPNARWGVTEGNPVLDDIRAIAAATGVTFSLDVTLDNRHNIVRAFGGDLFAAHAAACESVRRSAMQPVPERFDVVVSSNAGFPLDQNLYQAVKGMSAAAGVVKPGGTVICLAECRDGFPDGGDYHRTLAAATSAAKLLEEIKLRAEVVPEQWQIQVQAEIMCRARVVVSTSFISDEALSAAHLEQTHDVEATVAQAGPRATICALPYGPTTVPYVN